MTYRRATRLVMAVGVLLRIVLLVGSAKHPADPRFVADPYAYLLMADHAYHGRFFVSFRGFPTAYLSVGYPFLLAMVRHLLFGAVSMWVTALLVNVVCFVATALAVPRLLGALSGGRLAGRSASTVSLVMVGLLAVYPDYLFATGLVMSELVASAFLVWMVVLTAEAMTAPRSVRHAVGAGLCAGMTAFVRPSMVLLLVFVPLALAIAGRWRGALLVLAAASLPVVPLVVNNVRVGAGIGVTSATWPNVCDGMTDPQGRFEWRRECRVTMLPGESHTAGTEARNVKWARMVARQEIKAHPWTWVGRMPLRIAHSVWSGGWATEFSVHWAQNYVWTTKLRVFMRLSQAFFLGLSVLGLWGMAGLARRRILRWWPVWVVVAGSLAGVPISFGQSRFGWPIAVVVLVPCASWKFAELFQSMFHRFAADPA